ncbi:centromere protein S [Strigops habroptila]|uniref:Centromere protein S n=1 Tax=Strigops habroptila TaxID=2489341 RepID=A0A672UES0_STRHB|nr:centromere protein S [Strigops habroptila]
MAAAQPRPSALGGKRSRAAEAGAMEAAGGEERFLLAQRLKAAVHYTVGCLCEEVAEERDVQFSKQTIAAITEITFRQCETFAKDLEVFARHAKRSTVTIEDVKLLARRSSSLLRYITEKSEELALSNMEQKEKKKKSNAVKERRTGEHEAAVTESEDFNMA